MSAGSTTPFSDMHLLTVLAETRSFIQAAERLGISRSSASMRVAALEKSVGVPLVRRSTRQVSLTEAGQQLVDDVAPAFERITSSFHAVHDLTGTPRGTLRVTAPVALGRQHISPSLGRFLLRYPEVSLELELTDRLVNLAHEGFDLAVRHVRHIPDNYVAWALARSESVLVASPDYLARRGRPNHPLDLAAHDLVLYRGSPRRLGFERKDGQGKPVYVDVRASFTANNSEVLRDVVLSGAGLGLLPDFSLAARQSASCAAQGEVSPEQAHAVAQASRHAAETSPVQAPEFFTRPLDPSLQILLPEWDVQGYFGSHILALRPFSPRVPLAVHCLVQHLQQIFAAVGARGT